MALIITLPIHEQFNSEQDYLLKQSLNLVNELIQLDSNCQALVFSNPTFFSSLLISCLFELPPINGESGKSALLANQGVQELRIQSSQL